MDWKLLNTADEVVLPDKKNFVLDNIHIEVGGKNKTAKQVQDVEYAIVATDDIDVGCRHQIPLWLPGF